MKKSEGNRLKYAVCESTLSTAARSPFPKGEGYNTRMPLFSHCQSEYTHMWKKNNDGQSLPCVGKVASGASRIGFWRDEKERGRSSQAGDIRAPEHRCAVPFPQWGRQRGGGFTAPKGSQPRLATLGSPFQGKGLAWTLPPLEGGAPKGRRLDGDGGIPDTKPSPRG